MGRGAKTKIILSDVLRCPCNVGKGSVHQVILGLSAFHVNGNHVTSNLDFIAIPQFVHVLVGGVGDAQAVDEGAILAVQILDPDLWRFHFKQAVMSGDIFLLGDGQLNIAIDRSADGTFRKLGVRIGDVFRLLARDGELDLRSHGYLLAQELKKQLGLEQTELVKVEGCNGRASFDWYKKHLNGFAAELLEYRAQIYVFDSPGG